MRFDRVIANPPFSLDAWGTTPPAPMRTDAFASACRPRPGRLAFVQHGRDAEQPRQAGRRDAARRAVPRSQRRRNPPRPAAEDLIEAVVGLPTNLFYGTGIPAAILIMNRDKPARAGQGAVRGSLARVPRRQRTELSARSGRGRNRRHRSRLPRCRQIRARRRPAEIEKNDWNLNISRYVDTAEAEQKVDVASAVAKLREAERHAMPRRR